jgi:hypothetical protein
MSTASMETGPIWVEVAGYAGTLLPDVEVSLEGKGLLMARFIEAKPGTIGMAKEPCHRFSLAFTVGDLTKFATAGGFAGLEIKTSDGRGHGVVHKDCKTKSVGRLFKLTELQKMLDEAETLIAAAAKYKSDGYARQWFGSIATTKTELANIHRRTADLHQAVGGLSQVVFQVVGGEYLGAIDPLVKVRLRGGPTCRILLGRGFSYTRYSWGEKVATIVHEMTHWFLDTIDDKLQTGFDKIRQQAIEEDAYGTKAIELTENEAQCSKALNNADNWAYYICQYRGETGGEDWRFFSESEMNSRGPFSQDPKNVDPLLVA